MTIGLILADDHPIILDGLAQIFSQEPDIAVLARCPNGDEALRAARAHRPDILILDLRMPGKDGLAVLRELQREKLPTKVVLLTAALDEDEVLDAVRLGARGVVLKEMAPQILIQCVRRVHAGGEWMEQHLVTRALDKLLRLESSTQQIAKVLTVRELEMVRLVAQGLRNKEIARRLSITEGTVKIHLHNIYEKLGVNGRPELIFYAKNQGLA